MLKCTIRDNEKVKYNKNYDCKDIHLHYACDYRMCDDLLLLAEEKKSQTTFHRMDLHVSLFDSNFTND